MSKPKNIHEINTATAEVMREFDALVDFLLKERLQSLARDLAANLPPFTVALITQKYRGKEQDVDSLSMDILPPWIHDLERALEGMDAGDQKGARNYIERAITGRER